MPAPLSAHALALMARAMHSVIFHLQSGTRASVGVFLLHDEAFATQNTLQAMRREISTGRDEARGGPTVLSPRWSLACTSRGPLPRRVDGGIRGSYSEVLES
ncbi:hypothetical protein NDU88_008518 [Pleurodeles waltl]|uniref:Uncharacterized protein n=1 Tax=Pleurodeles waltl TaxID=8319 RepID=A0AAV7N9D6_PLEWA|nr:hypothetical protein NDU88_008518 [Pleurodeles waltl]